MTYGAIDSLQIVHITAYTAKENIPCSIGIKASISYWYLATYDKCLTFAFVNVRARQIYYIYNKNISWETYIFFDLLIFKDNMIFHLYFPDEIGLIVWENVCTGECVCFDSLKLLMI